MNYHFVKLTNNESKLALYGIVFDHRNIILFQGKYYSFSEFFIAFGSNHTFSTVSKSEVLKAKMEAINKDIQNLKRKKLNLPITSDFDLI